MRTVKIFDTTLRDGEQTPGASLTAIEKLEIARQLARLNVDVIEAGFPYSSKGDFESVRTIAKEVRGPVICGLARCIKADIEAAAQALKPAKHSRIHAFIGTSPIHMKMMKKGPAEVLAMATSSIRLAKRYSRDVEFSPMDATRSDPDFLASIVEAVIKEGATTVNIPDTVGYSTPKDFGDLIRELLERVAGLDRVTLSVHCHNDLGLAVANSLAGVENGVNQIECSMNGLGERAGNASLEEVVMALRTRRNHYNCATGVRSEEIHRTSRLVSRLTGIAVQANKAIVGVNAFMHGSGIHGDGVIKGRETFEIMTPESVGLKESGLMLGKLSGRHMLKKKLEELGFYFADGRLQEIFTAFKALADKKKNVYDEDIITLAEPGAGRLSEYLKLEDLEIASGLKRVPVATVVLRRGKKLITAKANGDGPVDATCKAIDKLTGLKPKMLDYSLRAITAGKDAQGEVSVRVLVEGQEMIGRGASTDIIEASARAYLNAMNRFMAGPATKATKRRR